MIVYGHIHTLYPLDHHDTDAFWTSPDMQAESARAMVDLGFTAVKFDPAGPYTMRRWAYACDDGYRSVCTHVRRAIRDAVGTRADLLFGTHGQFSTGGAIRMGRAIENFDPLWYEEPVPPDNIGSMRKVAQAVRIPIATGERLTTKAEFAPVLREGAATILQPALGRSGGILETKKIAAMARGLQCTDGTAFICRALLKWAANVQLAVNIPNILMAGNHPDGGWVCR